MKTDVESDTDKTVELVGEDVDLIVIVTASCDLAKNLIFKKPGREGRKDQIFNVPQFAMNPVSKTTIIFVHAFTGCDSTSSLFFKGKRCLWELV